MTKINECDVNPNICDTHRGKTLIDKTNGATNTFSFGISEYFSDEFGEEGIHDEQEGFYVIEGNGTAKIGSNIFDIEKGDAFIVPKGTKHTLKKSKNTNVLKVLWAHGA
ncbi:cupin domain-containing protein [Poseidonibacter ostreae]|uniref:Cupin domain-containing protein n=1 Tax=Poseidonibacter ostreae TaxID=2654171 RepID=A0A6L4WUE0_9BACT|nr:cupin domain-containing protein [Poseidonibacter ostreae]KAB7889780.1 cupin domain-containing protein [Poseidonibacter ostreae]